MGCACPRLTGCVHCTVCVMSLRPRPRPSSSAAGACGLPSPPLPCPAPGTVPVPSRQLTTARCGRRGPFEQAVMPFRAAATCRMTACHTSYRAVTGAVTGVAAAVSRPSRSAVRSASDATVSANPAVLWESDLRLKVGRVPDPGADYAQQGDGLAGKRSTLVSRHCLRRGQPAFALLRRLVGGVCSAYVR